MTATVGLFATCIVDLFRPRVGFAAARLIAQAGYAVTVPARQTCCGQPAYNAGARRRAVRIAKAVIAVFERFDHVVVPSGSCASILRCHYPGLLDGDPGWAARARALAERTHELTSFLVDVAGWRPAAVTPPDGTLTYHDACSGLRELGVRDQPRALLRAIDGLALVEMDAADVCCGFGGAFCVKYPAVSEAMADAKIGVIRACGADHLLAGDLGCLLHLAGRLARAGAPVRVRHTAEVLAGMSRDPAIAEPAGRRS